MEFETVVPYGSGKACYRIIKEKPGIYFALLLVFDGPEETSPPHEITLIRGIRDWKGSADDDNLIYTLGQMIESKMVAPLVTVRKKPGTN